MALKSTIYKAALNISDIDRAYYADHALTIARHPSETDERMMVRLIAFALNASDRLSFGKGLSDDDEPDLWEKDLTGAVARWIEVGLPDERRLRHACGRAEQVVVVSYGHAADVWWRQNAHKLSRLSNLSVFRLPTETSLALSQLSQRSMQLQCTLQDGQIWLSTDNAAVHIHPLLWQAAAPSRYRP
jgi:uncharacterized protein YaeQ